eukprot:g6177.t1
MLLRRLLRLRQSNAFHTSLIPTSRFVSCLRSNDNPLINWNHSLGNRSWIGDQRSFWTFPSVRYRGPKYRARNKDRALEIGSSDDQDRDPRRYVFVSDDDERLLEDTTTDSDQPMNTSDDESLNDEVWRLTNEETTSETLQDPDSHFEEWKKLAGASSEVETKELTWAIAGLEATRRILTRAPLDPLTLHSFKYMDPFGSPSIDEISIFSEQLKEDLEEVLGASTMAGLEFEVSTPGAERQVRVPFKLQRFQHLPMTVTYHHSTDSKTQTAILEFIELDLEAKMTKWKYWNGRHNRTTVKLSKSEFTKVFSIGMDDLVRVNLFVDV